LSLKQIEKATKTLFLGEEKRARRKIPKGVKQELWKKYFGKKYTGKCYVCSNPIHITDFEAGHNRSLSKGGSDRITNLRPICGSCNNSMSTMSIETYKKRFFSKRRRKTPKKRKRRMKSPIEKLLFG